MVAKHPSSKSSFLQHVVGKGEGVWEKSGVSLMRQGAKVEAKVKFKEQDIRSKRS